jgi:hypothetical protein
MRGRVLCALQVMPGPPVALALGPGQAQGEHLAVINTEDARARLLLPAAALQAQDAHGNAAAAPGLRVRLALRWPDGQPGGSPSFHFPPTSFAIVPSECSPPEHPALHACL